MRRSRRVQSFRQQVAQSMAELETIMRAGQSISGDDRFTVRTLRVVGPSSYSAAAIRDIRHKLGVSQAVFAQLLGVSQVLVRSWERGVRKPASIACRLLDLIRENPHALTSLIHPAAPAQDHAFQLRQRRRSASAA